MSNRPATAHPGAAAKSWVWGLGLTLLKEHPVRNRGTAEAHVPQAYREQAAASRPIFGNPQWSVLRQIRNRDRLVSPPIKFWRPDRLTNTEFDCRALRGTCRHVRRRRVASEG